jgi:hypothetical protein
MHDGRQDQKPWDKWYWQDYLADTGLAACSLAARGLWIEMLAIMARSEKKGYLLDGNQKMSEVVLARLARSTVDEIVPLLQELNEHKVFSMTEDGIIYNRRMVREAEISEKRAEAGKIGGLSKKQKSSKAEANALARSVSASVYASEYNNKEEEKGMGKETSKAIPIELPTWIDSNLWHDYLEMRKKIRKPATLRAQELVIKKLDELRAEGQDPNRVLEQSIENSWQGVFPLKPLDASSGYQKPLRASQTGKNPDIGYPPGYWEKVRELKAKGFEGEALTAELKKIPHFAESKK